MPITPTPMPYGFTSADIASMGRAREGLLAGFEALGQQVRQDMARIGTMRQLKGFGEELQQLDPQNQLFPQQAAGLMARYPLAASTGVGRAGIDMLGRQYDNWVDAQAKMGVGEIRSGASPLIRVSPTGEVETIYTPPETAVRPVAGRVVETQQGQVLIDPVTGETRRNFGFRPQTPGRTPAPSVSLDVREMVNSRGKQVEELRILLTKPDTVLRDQFQTDRPTVTRQILDLESEMRQIANPAPQAGINAIGADAQVAVPPAGASRAQIQAATPLPTGRGIATESLTLMGPATQAAIPPARTAAPTPLPAQQVPPGTPAPLPEELPALTQPQRTVLNRRTGQIETLTLVDGQWQRLP